jgi:Putative general bacterial porin
MFCLQKSSLITLLGLLYCASTLAEQTYQVEITGSFDKENTDTSSTKTAGVLAETFFTPVTIENKPLAEAAFLGKNSSVLLGYYNSKTEFQNSVIDSMTLKIPLIGINYITKGNAFILAAAYTQSNIDTNNNQINGDQKLVTFTIGKYLDDFSTLDFSYLKQNISVENTLIVTSNDIDIYSYIISYKTVRPLGDDKFYQLGASYELTKQEDGTTKEDNTILSIGGQYFLTRMTSLGGKINFNSGDDKLTEGKTFEINASHFITPQIAFTFALSRFAADDSQTDDASTASIELIARF